MLTSWFRLAPALLLAALLAVPLLARAQEPNPGMGQQLPPAERVYQLSGLVLDAKNGLPIPHVAIRIRGTLRGGLTNIEGFFSLPVLETDTLEFRCLGFVTSTLVIRDYLASYSGDKTSDYIYEIQYLSEDEITLPTVTIYPYNTPEELRAALLNIPVNPNDPATIARNNVSPQLMAYFTDNLPDDPQERLKVAQMRYYELYKTQNDLKTVPLVDPLAIYNLFKYLSDKGKLKKEKIYNYWPE